MHGIIDPLPTTLVPRAPAYVPGLINVRGSVVPVLDLRQRLGMPPAEPTEHSRMVVLDVEIAEAVTKLAVIADSVEQVLEIETAAIEPVPEIGIRFPVRFLAGLARRGGDLLILLRTETVFAPEPCSDARHA
ncbi:hypothetical protein LNKW23_29600 [Paralimibaculum aggregatum]|uniref:CheW-like domain-containing protein n=1 Tax=Paralimibaculum aggregatum TaxID=3036245 RepID=A0ABQ6LKH1_9RHOB|nr:hypothetical protein LNKW23_29600 [Limibaculum sp. NKW23]